jgi:hypothetical protein
MEGCVLKKQPEITKPEIEEAYLLRAHGLSYGQIAKRLGRHTAATIQAALYDRYRRKRENPGKTNHRVARHLDPYLPPAVQAEAETVQSIDWDNLTTSQQYLGDPRPGRSAIDRLSPADRRRLGLKT